MSAEANEVNGIIAANVEELQNVDHNTGVLLGDVLKANGAAGSNGEANWKGAPPQAYVTTFVAGAVSAAAIPYRIYMPVAGTVRGVTLTAGTAPVTQGIIADVRKNGTGNSLFGSGNQPTIAAAAHTSGEFVPDVTGAFAVGDYLDVNVTQVGTGTTGSNLYVLIRIA